jgi:high affinity Mn2+ porin
MRTFLSMFVSGLSSRVRWRIAAFHIFLLVFGLCAFSVCAESADLPVRAPLGKAAPSYDDWTGLYVGGHVGYSRGNAQVTLADLGDTGPTNFTRSFGSLSGGMQLGYNYLLPSHVLLGIEADMSFLNYLAADDVTWSRITAVAHSAEKIDYMATLRGRLGYAFPRWMIYATGGLALSLGRFLQTPGITDDTDKLLHPSTGWAAGAGAEVAIAPSWTARVEYLYRNFGHTGIVFPSGTSAGSSFDVQSVRVALNYKLGSGANAGAGNSAGSSQSQFDNWEIHGQTTYIQQGYPAFRSPYVGENSFTPWAQTRNTWTTSAFLGLRVWEGGELYYNPELLQGFGLHNTTGAAGFPNGEAQKSNFPYPRYNTSRLFLRQTVGLGGEEETIESSYGQMAGKKDVSRLTFQIGKFSVHDVFDNNRYATDSRADFLNWSIWAAGAFDYSADRVGLTYGGIAELNEKYWALRTGYFLMPNEANANEFDMNMFRRGSYVTELETRYWIWSLAGKFRVGVWANTYFAGSYSEALDLVALNPGLDPTDALFQSRRSRTKYGYYLNFEQSLTEQIGVFGRWSWNDGKNEIAVFTDIDTSLSLGASIAGKNWGRPDDKVGVAVAINSISKDHRDYLAAGGLGILIGDSALNYSHEKILETYYAMYMMKGLILTFNYQYMMNPAYNADRGPVSFFSGRLHGEF